MIGESHQIKWNKKKKIYIRELHFEIQFWKFVNAKGTAPRGWELRDLCPINFVRRVYSLAALLLTLFHSFSNIKVFKLITMLWQSHGTPCNTSPNTVLDKIYDNFNLSVAKCPFAKDSIQTLHVHYITKQNCP